MKKLLRPVLLSLGVLLALTLTLYLTTADPTNEIVVSGESRSTQRAVDRGVEVEILLLSFTTNRPPQSNEELEALRRRYPTPVLDYRRRSYRDFRWEISEDGLTHTRRLEIETRP